MQKALKQTRAVSQTASKSKVAANSAAKASVTSTRRKAASTINNKPNDSPIASTSKLPDIEPRPAIAPSQSVSLTPFVSNSNEHASSNAARDSHQEQSSQFIAGGLPLPASSVPIPHTRHPFNTHRFVSELERASFSRDAAKSIMRATKSLLVYEESRASQQLVGKGDLENEAYLFKAALGELQTEVMVQARNDSIALRSANGQLQREIDNFQQKLREDVADLKNNIQLDFNSRKEESSIDQKNLELKIMDLSNKFTVSLGDLRTDLEANKWLQTRRSLVMISASLLLVISLYSYTSEEAPPPRPPSIDELGLTQSPRTELSPFYTPSRRVGEEEDN